VTRPEPREGRSGSASSTETAREHRLRQALLVIAALTIAGTAVELVVQHHWTKPTQLVAWLAVLALAIDEVWLIRAGTARDIKGVRVVAYVVMASAVLGMFLHVLGNYEAGPLDAVYGEKWDSMSELNRWWQSTIQAVGPSPALAPGTLIIAALCLLFAARDHPVLEPLELSAP